MLRQFAMAVVVLQPLFWKEIDITTRSLMHFGICFLSIVPVRLTNEDSSEMCTQLLYGDYFKVLEKRKERSKIRVAHDGMEGWIFNNQYQLISKEEFDTFSSQKSCKHSADVVSHICKSKNDLMPIVLGSYLDVAAILGHEFEGNFKNGTILKSDLVPTAILYLNSPFQKGGKTPFGIDAPGFTQMVYKINGFALKRTAEAQSGQGEVLSFIEESEPGDLAFFDNKEGIIDHVGIILKDNYIIHAHGCVRIDRLDHTGIFNATEKIYSHKLRVIKKII